jgi:outer membrane putative beta-barrel porin/alpha-amylase
MITRGRIRWLLALAVVGAAGAAPALACDSSSCALLTRGQSGTLPKGAFRLDLSFRYTEEDVKLEGSQAVADVYVPKVAFTYGSIWPAFHREIHASESFLQMDLGYGVTSRLSLNTSVPLFTQREHTVAHFGLTQRYATQGIGDVLVGARFSVRPRLAAGFAVSMPTGRHRLDGDFDGSILDPSLQPGSGAFGYVGTLQQTGRLAALELGWSVAASYQANMRNDLDYRFGNAAILTLNLRRPVVGKLSASLQGKLFYQTHNVYLARDVPSTGMTVFYVTPALHYDAPGGVSAYAYLQLPSYRYVNDMQLAPRAAVLTGLSKTF